MQRAGWLDRFLVPGLIALVILISSRGIYFNSVKIDNQSMYHWVAIISGIIYFISIALATMVIYPVTFFKGATPAERIIACSLNPAIWVTIESYREGVAFNFFECLYFGLGIGSIVFIWNFTLMGIYEIICRCILKKRGVQVRAMTPASFIPMVIFFITILVLSRDGGAYFFNLLLDGYIMLFRT
jgi:hypothetical protein